MYFSKYIYKLLVNENAHLVIICKCKMNDKGLQYWFGDYNYTYTKLCIKDYPRFNRFCFEISKRYLIKSLKSLIELYDVDLVVTFVKQHKKFQLPFRKPIPYIIPRDIEFGYVTPIKLLH